MSGRATVQLLLIIACTLTTLTDCARPLEEDELKTIKLGQLETSQQISNLPPPQLPSAHRAGSNSIQQRPRSPIEELYNLKRESMSQSGEPERVQTRSLVESDQIDWGYMYRGMLHRIPAGPNPIGNEYRPGDTAHNVEKYRCPPPQG